MTLARTWAALVGLSGLTAALTAYDPLRPVLVIGLMLLAGAKARLILGQFLELHKAPGWQRVADLSLGILLLGFAALALVR